LPDRQQQTGVSLDEELIKILQFQHSYQAAARIISTVSLSAGMPGENAQIQQLESGADAVFLGEVREPEVLGYAQDMAASRKINLFLAGHTNEDAGMGVVADWLGTVFPQLPVKWLPLVDPYTNPA